MLLKIGKYILAVTGWVVSLLLTINLVTSIFGTETLFWTIIGVSVGFIFNLAEVVCLKYWEKNRKRENKEVKAALALAMCISFFFLSVSASVGSLELSYERAVKGSEIYQLKSRQIALQDTVISGLSQTANKQRDINHITKSQQTLLVANDGLKNLDTMQDDLENLSSFGAGLGNALYRVYAKLFGLGTHTVALIFNLIVSFLIESLMLFFAGNDDKKGYYYLSEYEAIKDENLEVEPALSGQKNDRIFGFNPSENGQRELSKKASGLQNFRTKFYQKIVSTVTPILGFLTVRKTEQSDKNSDTNRTEKSVRAAKDSDENSNKKKCPIGRKTGQNKAVRADERPDEFLVKIYTEQFKGKSDEFILYVWDNWEKVGKGNRSLRNVQKTVIPILPRRQKISHQYVDRVLQKNGRKEV